MSSPLFAPGPSLAELDERAREIFRRIVESYLETGEPVGSRTLSKGGLHLSPASIRNTMQDLTQLGLLGAPHVSAGRLPTHAGLRLFVDGLLEVGDVGAIDRQAIEARLHAHGRNYEDALNEASAILSGLAGGAGVVVTPIRDAGVKHVEFVSLGAERTLAVMVFADGTVENRLIRLPAGVTPSALTEASNFLNARLRGRTLVEAKTDLKSDLDKARRELDATAARLVEDGLAAWGGGEAEDRALIVRGRANLSAWIGAAKIWSGCARSSRIWNRCYRADLAPGRGARGGKGCAHFHRGGNPALLAFRFRCDRRALYDGVTTRARRDRRDRSGPG